MTGLAEPVTDPAACAEALRAMLAKFLSYGKYINVSRDPDGRPNEDDIARAIEGGRVLVEVRLGREGGATVV